MQNTLYTANSSSLARSASLLPIQSPFSSNRAWSLRDNNPEVIYGIIEDVIQEGQAFIELPLGEGQVDFPNYLKALDDIGYHGFLTIEREVGEDPEKDIRKAADFLRSLM